RDRSRCPAIGLVDERCLADAGRWSLVAKCRVPSAERWTLSSRLRASSVERRASSAERSDAENRPSKIDSPRPTVENRAASRVTAKQPALDHERTGPRLPTP